MDCFRFGIETRRAFHLLQPVLIQKIISSISPLSCTSLSWSIMHPEVWCALPICPSCLDEAWQSTSVLSWYYIRYQSVLKHACQHFDSVIQTLSLETSLLNVAVMCLRGGLVRLRWLRRLSTEMSRGFSASFWCTGLLSLVCMGHLECLYGPPQSSPYPNWAASICESLQTELVEQRQ